MSTTPIPRINYSHAPSDGHNFYRRTFKNATEEQWRELLIRSITEPVIEGAQFPAYPEEELQIRVHGNSNQIAMSESFEFYRFVKQRTYSTCESSKDLRLLDFASGWGRIIRPFMYDFEFSNLFAYEPDFLFCTLARTLNPYVNFLTGGFTPDNKLPSSFFDLMIGWSIFSHLSQTSATLWLKEAAKVVRPGGYCVFTTWGERFLQRLLTEADQRNRGIPIHWYSSVCIDAAGSIEDRITDYRSGEYVWFTSGHSLLYGETFLSHKALKRLLQQHSIPFEIEEFDCETLSQDAFVLRRL